MIAQTITKKDLKQSLLDELYAPYKNCNLCPLSQGRKQVVFGRGNADARLLIIGEGPGADEDAQGLPFVGRSGKLLSKTFLTLGILEQDLYITNIVKCRPPNNRAPLPNEVAVCTNILLHKQIAIIKPKIICALGASAAQTLLKTDTSISKLRGAWHPYQGALLIATYHPAYILRNPKELTKLTTDLQTAFNASISI